MKDKIKVYDFECTCGACPTQFEFRSANGKKWYFRYRHGCWKLCDVTNDDDWQLIIEGRYSDENGGIMSEEQFLELTKLAGYDFEIVTRKEREPSFKSLRDLVNLCRDDLAKANMRIHATLDREDLEELKDLIEWCDLITSKLRFYESMYGYNK